MVNSLVILSVAGRERYEWVVELLSILTLCQSLPKTVHRTSSKWVFEIVFDSSSVGPFGLSQTHPPQMPGYEAPCSLRFEVHGLDGDLNNFAFSQVMILFQQRICSDFSVIYVLSVTVVCSVQIDESHADGRMFNN
jgi:hypothetical protein